MTTPPAPSASEQTRSAPWWVILAVPLSPLLLVAYLLLVALGACHIVLVCIPVSGVCAVFGWGTPRWATPFISSST